MSRLFCWCVLLGILVACSNEGELAPSTVPELPPSSTSNAPPEPTSPDTAASSTSISLPAEFPATRTGEYVLVSPGFFSTGLNATAPVLIAYHPATDTWTLVDDETPIGLGTKGHLVGGRILIEEDVITGSNRMFVSPAGWQPTGEVIRGNGP